MVGVSFLGRELGRYKVLSIVGSGGFATVYRAVDTALERTVALKVVDPAAHHNPTVARRFLREGEAVASLDHPAVVPVYDAGEDDGVLFLAMRLIEGGSLDDALRAGRRMTSEQLVAVVARIGGALDHAHDHGIVHRDIKPSNILLEDNDPRRAWLADFGIATTARTMGQYTTGALGTAAYMAPEQSRPGGTGPASDIYSLACVAYEMITGHRPYPGEDYVALLLAHANQPVPPIGNPAIDALMARALAKDPSLRPRSGGELTQALREALAAGDVPTTPQDTGTAATIAARPAPPSPASPVGRPSPASPVGPPSPPGHRPPPPSPVSPAAPVGPGQEPTRPPVAAPQAARHEPAPTVIQPRHDTLLHPGVHRPPPPQSPVPPAPQYPHRPPPDRRGRTPGRNRVLLGAVALLAAAAATYLALPKESPSTAGTVLVTDRQGIEYRVPDTWVREDVRPVTRWSQGGAVVVTVTNLEASEMLVASDLLEMVRIEGEPVCTSEATASEVAGAATGAACREGDVVTAVGAVRGGQFWLVTAHPDVPADVRETLVESIRLFDPQG